MKLQTSKTAKIVPVMKLTDKRSVAGQTEQEDMTTFHIWALLSGGQAMKDLTAANRKFT